MILAWLQQRRAERALIAADADALIERFGDNAYLEARNWVIGELNYKIVDADRRVGHWARVRAEIFKRTNPPTMADSATRRLQDR